jgi:hypothetical protein
LLNRSYVDGISRPKPAVVERTLALSGRPSFPDETN